MSSYSIHVLALLVMRTYLPEQVWYIKYMKLPRQFTINELLFIFDRIASTVWKVCDGPGRSDKQRSTATKCARLVQMQAELCNCQKCFELPACVLNFDWHANAVAKITKHTAKPA